MGRLRNPIPGRISRDLNLIHRPDRPSRFMERLLRWAEWKRELLRADFKGKYEKWKANRSDSDWFELLPLLQDAAQAYCCLEDGKRRWARCKYDLVH